MAEITEQGPIFPKRLVTVVTGGALWGDVDDL